ncbi:MAG TPA: alpha-L-fucosidase [Haliscomenobacter sp.]|uniref:alpha-L-fucosidase n=1 Tax=Haliscomenobacter sp. TaxID=2717303 RepID=UPI002C50D6E3|nr:alpha-L-fucosidase [Haliscomenobacter sp.]HOY16104.1 alpha-L-fucosidase [Haliscomenobacter sp.]HPH17517.1 alpha-L-fucosidase [Haliscomenobacter sp.]
MKPITFIILMLLGWKSFGQKFEPVWQSLDQRATPVWFEDAKFGIFIHWGIYSVPAWATTSNADGFGSGYSEWYWQRLFAPNLKIHPEFVAFHQKNYGTASYQDFVQQFKAELFKPEDWARIFEEAGAKYVVLTSKHHEGFTLWPSAQSWNWNAVDVGPHRDLAGDLAKAVKARNLRMGFYYSLYEWFNPVYKSDVQRYVTERMLPQMKDLVTRYEPDVLWTDGEWDHPAKTWQSEAFLAWLFNESKVKDQIVVNDRWGNDTKGQHGSFRTSEYGQGAASNSQRPWEECRGMGESFGYNRNENLEMYQSGEQLVHQLIDIVARGGNLLLNIGPNADGQIPVIMQERLHEIGSWLKVNGAAIYGSRKWANAPVYNKETQVYFTQKGQNLYAIQRKWANTLVIPNVAKPVSVKLLGYNGVVKFSYKNNTLSIFAPQLNPGNIPCDYAWTYELEGGF